MCIYTDTHIHVHVQLIIININYVGLLYMGHMALPYMVTYDSKAVLSSL